MNDQDSDLIFALAQGTLSPTAAEAATTRITADPELASEYADQVVALQFLRSASPPLMTESERSALRTNLTTQLGLLPVASPTPVPSTKKSRWWLPAFGMATAAAVVFAFVIFPGAQQDSFQEVSMELDDASADTSLVAESSPQTTANATAAAEESEGVQFDSAAAPSLTGEDPVSVYETDSVALEELLTRTEGANSNESVQRQLSGMSFESRVDLSSDEVNACLSELATEVPDDVLAFHVIGADVDRGLTTVHVGFDFGEGVEDGMSFVLETCEFVQHAPQG